MAQYSKRRFYTHSTQLDIASFSAFAALYFLACLGTPSCVIFDDCNSMYHPLVLYRFVFHSPSISISFVINSPWTFHLSLFVLNLPMIYHLFAIHLPSFLVRNLLCAPPARPFYRLNKLNNTTASAINAFLYSGVKYTNSLV